MKGLIATFARIVEVAILRAAPGLLNVGAIVLVAPALGADKFGVFSTVVATATFVSTMIYGTMSQAIVSEYERIRGAGDGDRYIGTLSSIAFIVSALLTVAGLAGMLVSIDFVPEIACIVAIGMHTIFQQVLRSKIKLWHYGIADTVQAVAYLIFAWFWRNAGYDVDMAIYAFSLSYFLGFLVAFAVNRFPLPTVLDLDLVRQTFRSGTVLSFSSLCETALLLGTRYAVAGFGSAQVLGVFSFSLDIAQRTVGFFVNAASFTFIPRAFRHEANGRLDLFHATLLKGAAAGAGLSAVAAAVIVGGSLTPWGKSYLGELFAPVSFLLISIAVVVNRLVKLVIVPLALLEKRTVTVAVSYLIGAVIAQALAFGLFFLAAPNAGEFAYLAGYLFVAAHTVVTFRSALRPKAASAKI